MKNLNTTESNNSDDANQNLINLKKQLDKYKLKQTRTYDYDDDLDLDDFEVDQVYTLNDIWMDCYDFNPCESFDLRCFFNLLTEEDKLEIIRTNEGREWYLSEEFIDFETILQVPEDDAYIDEHIENEIYIENEKILITCHSDYYQAYKIGLTINQSKFIGACFYQEGIDDTDIYKVIRWYLATGKYGWYA